MNEICNGKFLVFRNLKRIAFLLSIVIYTNAQGQSYPPQEQLPNVNYQDYSPPSGAFPGYLQPFTEPLSGSTVTRISDRDEFGVTGQRLRHNYSKDQTWNSNGTLIKLAGYPSAILDGETYEFLYWSDIPSYGRWSNTQPNIIYGTSGRSFVSHNVNTNQRTTLRTFNEYNSIDFGYGEGNQDKYDRYVGLIGKRGGSDITLIVYDIQNDVVVGTKDIDNAGDLDWFSVSQLGGFAVAQWHANGLGDKQGIKSYNINLENEIAVYATTQHGDLGVDAFGNEVIVEYGNEPEWDEDHSLYMARLDGGGTTLLFPYVNGRGIWGGHISTRNLDRPGWAYISEQCCPNNPVAPAELFAIKLDGSGTIERYGKHNAEPSTYLHETQNVPNRNGTKILFASNWFNSTISSHEAPPAFVLEYPQSAVGLSVNAGDDVAMCEGDSVTLNATGVGGTSYSWSNGSNSQSISVSPDTTTTYTVTLSNGSGDEATDSVTVTVNPSPNADAGNDVTIDAGETVTLTASGGGAYEWNTGETTQSIEVSPESTATYTVVVTQNNCSSEDAVLVTVNPIPVIANAGDDVTICNGDSITLTASGGETYEWSTGETAQSITVSPEDTTTYSVMVSDGVTSDTDSVIVTVNPLPIANAGNDVTIDAGETVTLTASGGGSYEWNTGETTQNIEVSPESTTTYTVVVTQNNCSSEDTVTVTVNNSGVPVVANAGDDVTICEGDSITLTASGGGTYEWSTGETTQSITVSPESTTIYTVTVSDGETSDSDDVTVTTNPLPIANAGDDVTIDSGETVTLTATGGESYEWNTGETTQNIEVSPEATTTYSVVVTQNNCSSSDEVIVNVEAAVVIVEADAGDDVTICQGETVTLTASGGSTYLWSTGETTQSIDVNPNSTETFTVTAYEGDVSDSDEVTVNVNPLPAAIISDDVTIEEGQSVTLSVSGGNSYSWNTGSTSQSITVNPTETTIYSATVYENGCSDVDTVVVTVVPLVNADAGDDVEICTGGSESDNTSATLTASGGLYYQWSTGETTQSITVSPESSTEYHVVVSNGFSEEDDTVNVFVTDCLSVVENDVMEPELVVFPNPASSEINIKVSGAYTQTAYVLYDMLGRSILTNTMESSMSTSQVKQVNVSNLPRGVYLLNVNFNGKTQTKRIILN